MGKALVHHSILCGCHSWTNVCLVILPSTYSVIVTGPPIGYSVIVAVGFPIGYSVIVALLLCHAKVMWS